MKSTILIITLLGVSFFGSTQTREYEQLPFDKSLTSTYSSWSVNQFEEYQNLSKVEEIMFYTRFNSTRFYDVENSIKNLIEEYGADFWRMSENELHELLNQTLRIQYIPNHPEYDYWSTRLDSLYERIKHNRKIPITVSDLRRLAWDGFIQYENLLFDSTRLMIINTNEPTNTSFLSQYSTSWDPMKERYTILELEEIRTKLRSITNVDSRADYYLLFMRNLFCGQHWRELFTIADDFIDLTINDYIQKPKESFVPFSLLHSLSQERGLPKLSQGDTVINALGNKYDTNLSFYHAEITDLIVALKLMMSCPHDNTEIHNYIMSNFGKIIAAIETNEVFETETFHKVKLMEIEYMMKLSQVYLFDNEYYNRTRHLLNIEQSREILNKFKRPTIDKIRFNLNYAGVANKYWRLAEVEDKELSEREKLEVAQFLFLAESYFRQDELDMMKAHRLKFQLLIERSEYFNLKRQHEDVTNTLICALELIESFPEHFTEFDVDLVLINIVYNYHHANSLDDCNNWIQLLGYNPVDDYALPQFLDGNIDNWNFQDLDLVATRLVEIYLDGGRTFEDQYKVLSPIYRRIASRAERGYLDRKKYKKAYDMALLRRETFTDQNKSLELLLNAEDQGNRVIAEKNYQERRKELRLISQEYQSKNLELSKLNEEIRKQRDALNNQLRKKQFELMMLNDSIAEQRILKAELDEQIIAYTDSINLQARVIVLKDSLNRKLEIEKANTARERDRATKNARDLKVANNRLSWFVVGLSALLVLIGIFIIILFFQQKRLRIEKRKAVLQKEISDCLRGMVSQVTHFGTNLINSFKKRHFDSEEDFKKLTYLDGKTELINTRRILQKCTRNSTDSILTQSIENEVEIGLNMAFIEYSEYYTLEQLKSMVVIEDNLEELNVPLYSLSNIIHNTFKHSVNGSVKKIIINGQIVGSGKMKLRIKEVAEKFDNLNLEGSGNGTSFIVRVLDIFNENIEPEFTRYKNKEGITTQFNLKLSA